MNSLSELFVARATYSIDPLSEFIRGPGQARARPRPGAQMGRAQLNGPGPKWARAQTGPITRFELEPRTWLTVPT